MSSGSTKCIHDQVQRFVGAIGQQQFVISHAEKSGQLATHGFLLRIHGDRGGTEIANRRARLRRASEGVFVEI